MHTPSGEGATDGGRVMVGCLIFLRPLTYSSLTCSLPWTSSWLKSLPIWPRPTLEHFLLFCKRWEAA